MAMKKRVFICYRQKTSGCFVEHLADRLKEMFIVFFDQIHGPVRVLREIKKEIDNCTHVILIVDEETFHFKEGEDYVLEEIKYVLKKTRDRKDTKIIPIIRYGCEMPPKDKLWRDGIESIEDYNRIYYNEKETFDNFFSRFLLERMEYDISTQKRKKKLIRLGRFFFLAIVLAVISIYGGIQLQHYISSKTPRIIFAGGGSVATMIKNKTNDSVDIENYPNALYLDLPSKNAWSLLAEEVMINHTSDSVTNKFYPVCLSALEANDSVFHRIVKPNDFMENGTIIQYYIGEDTLIVFSNEEINKHKITIDELSRKVKEWSKDTLKAFVYITQEGSGTYSIYQKEMNDIINIDNYKSTLKWYNGTLCKKNLPTNKKYMILSSQYYTPDDIRDLQPNVVVNERGDTITKAMFLYFVGYTKKNAKQISIPKEMVHFLKKIDQDTDNIITTQMHQDTTMIITPFNKLKEWERRYRRRK